MSTMFQTASPTCQKLDPLKRVNYTFGLVLGVDEFLQSDTYFLAKHHLENRLLHGYGTVCGLDVIAQTNPQIEVQVTPGWAINPKGQEIHVPQLMCVRLNDWLQANQSDLQAASPGPVPSTLNLCVVLCYRECKTDVVPIPGEPCQTQSSSTAPSRIADSFELMLCLDRTESPPLESAPCGPPMTGGLCEYRPPKLEDDAIRALAWLLCQLQVSTTGPFLSLEQLEQLVLDLGTTVWPPLLGSPPAGPPYAVHVSDLPSFRRAALRTWITKVRPFIAAGQGAGPCCAPPEKCVLLAELVVTLVPGPGQTWSATGVTVDDSVRPFLVPTRLLQELFSEDAEAAAAVAAPTAKCVSISAVSGNAITPVTMVGSGGISGPYTFTAMGLPSGLTMAPNGTISGTPTASGGPANYTVTVKDSAGNTGTVSCSATVNAAPTAKCVSISAVAGTAITAVTMVGSGGMGGPYTFTAMGLPSGLTMAPNGTISGTPTASGGPANYTVTVKDSVGNTGTVSCSVTVQQAVTSACVAITGVATIIDTLTSPPAVQGSPAVGAPMVGSGGVGGPYTFTATGLPSGLTMASNGAVSGTPTASGTFNYTVTVKDSAGNAGTVSCSVTVNPAPPVTGICVSFSKPVVKLPITSVTMAASGGVGGPYTFTANGLPAGLTMASNGTVSGTPLAIGTFSYTVTIKDSAGNAGIVNCSVTVAD